MEFEEVLQKYPDFKKINQIGKFIILYNEKTKKYGIYDIKTRDTKGNFTFKKIFRLTTSKAIICQNEDDKYYVYGKGVPTNKKVDDFVINDGSTIMLGDAGFYTIYDIDFKLVSTPFKFSADTISFIKKYYSLNQDERNEYLRTHSISMEVASIMYLVDKNNEAYSMYDAAKKASSYYGKKLNEYFNHLESNISKYGKFILPSVPLERFKNMLLQLGKGLKDDLSYVY